MIRPTLSTRYMRASNVQRAFHTRLGHATEATSNKVGTRMERTLAWNLFETYKSHARDTPSFYKIFKHV